MPRIKRRLTPGKLNVIKAYALTNSTRAAAAEAGMSVSQTTRLLHDPEVMKGVVREQMHLLTVVGVPVAVATLIDVAKNGKSEMARVTASDKIVKLAGKEIAEGLLSKSWDNMSIDELKAELDEAKRRRAELAEVIDVTAEPGSNVFS